MDYLAGKYGLTCPALHRDQGALEPVSEEVRRVRDPFDGTSIEQRFTKIVLVVPFDGEPNVFGLTPSQFSSNPPSAQVNARGELRLTWLGDPQTARNAAAIL